MGRANNSMDLMNALFQSRTRTSSLGDLSAYSLQELLDVSRHNQKLGIKEALMKKLGSSMPAEELRAFNAAIKQENEDTAPLFFDAVEEVLQSAQYNQMDYKS